MNVSSLTDVTLSFYESCLVPSATTLDCVERTLSQILPAIQHVKGLTLSHCCIKALQNRKSKCLLSPLPNVKILTLHSSFKEHEQMVDLLEIFPKLKTLVVEEQIAQSVTRKRKLRFKPNSSKSFLEELRTVDVTCTSHDYSIFQFIRSLLKHASKLEKMMLRVERTPRHSRRLKELQRMPRSSPTAEVIFCD